MAADLCRMIWVDKTLLDHQQQQGFPGARTLLAPVLPHPTCPCMLLA